MARIRTDYPRAVREIEHLWISLSDGTRLAARIWLPVDAEAHPVPAILEYLPYRKNDDTAFRDALHHPYFAGHGYAAVRVDLRGSGESDGILYDEYLEQEQDDALEVLSWLEAQPWCSGEVGMIGLSWGGFNGLQVAARRPPQLKAVIALGFTDDRYHDDVHYKGGVLLAHDMNVWASNMLGFLASPPDPQHYGDAWREVWLERLEQTPPLCRGLDSAPAPRRLLATRVCVRRLRRDYLPGLPGHGLGGFLQQQRPALARRTRRAPQSPYRSVGARLSVQRKTGSSGRLFARVLEVVRPASQRYQHRHHGGAQAARLASGQRSSCTNLFAPTGALGG